ncbi:MAG: serine hydrolase domain-containing protein, partial [Bacteroidota bacterium]
SDAYRTDDIFRIASMTKAITTVSILQLYERGLLGLDDPIGNYLPAFRQMQLLDNFNPADSSYTTTEVKRPITIRQLLTHTSGITYGSFNPGKIGAVYAQHEMNAVGLSHPEWTTSEMVDRLARVPLVFTPGDRYMYGLNMEVLGRIVEVVTGKTLADYFRTHIFEPLGMKDTYFYLPADKHSRLVPVFTYDQDGSWTLIPPGNLDYPKATPRNHYAGGGGLSSTALDYARFIHTLELNHSGHGYPLLGRKTMELMTSDQIARLKEEGKGFTKIDGLTYGLGFALYTDQGAGIDSKSPGTF